MSCFKCDISSGTLKLDANGQDLKDDFVLSNIGLKNNDIIVIIFFCVKRSRTL